MTLNGRLNDRTSGCPSAMSSPNPNWLAPVFIWSLFAALWAGGSFPDQINYPSTEPADNVRVQFFRQQPAPEDPFFKEPALGAPPSDQSLLIAIEELLPQRLAGTSAL